MNVKVAVGVDMEKLLEVIDCHQFVGQVHGAVVRGSAEQRSDL